MNGLALCAGVGGLELGLSLALGRMEYRTVCYVERDAYAAAVLVARMADAALDCAPVWDDVATFRGAPWRGVVDIVSAGFPCQPWSVAGKHAGATDTRWLWPDVARVVREVEPVAVFLENVPGFLAGGLGHVLGDLATLGFAAEWDCFRASDVGAPHRRKRLFLLAHAHGSRQRVERVSGLRDGNGAARGDHADGPRGEGHFLGVGLADPERPGLEIGRGERAHLEGQCAALERGGDHALAPFPPRPDDASAWARVLAARPDLAPAQPRLRGLADGLAPRVDRLRAAGNGVVPQQAARAFVELNARLMR
jgi:DNA (cytosine-5)-methyltransferase 1